MNSSKPSVVVLGDAIGDLVVRADERGADPAADETDAGPHVGVHDQAVVAATVQRRHALLADGLRRREIGLGRRDRVVAHAGPQCVARPPTPRRRSGAR